MVQEVSRERVCRWMSGVLPMAPVREATMPCALETARVWGLGGEVEEEEEEEERAADDSVLAKARRAVLGRRRRGWRNIVDGGEGGGGRE